MARAWRSSASLSLRGSSLDRRGGSFGLREPCAGLRGLCAGLRWYCVSLRGLFVGLQGSCVSLRGPYVGLGRLLVGLRASRSCLIWYFGWFEGVVCRPKRPLYRSKESALRGPLSAWKNRLTVWDKGSLSAQKDFSRLERVLRWPARALCRPEKSLRWPESASFWSNGALHGLRLWEGRSSAWAGSLQTERILCWHWDGILSAWDDPLST